MSKDRRNLGAEVTVGERLEERGVANDKYGPVINRSAVTGEFVTAEEVEANPETTVVEKKPRRPRKPKA